MHTGISGHSVRGEANPLTKYEIVFILQADEPASEMDAHVAKVESIITERGGEITERNHWGVRQLAYEINHETRGNYMHILYKAEGDANEALDNELRLDHKVLRHQIVVDEEWQARNAANRARRPDLSSHVHVSAPYGKINNDSGSEEAKPEAAVEPSDDGEETEE
jgi:small subunit ribosomal protein S6